VIGKHRLRSSLRSSAACLLARMDRSKGAPYLQFIVRGKFVLFKDDRLVYKPGIGCRLLFSRRSLIWDVGLGTGNNRVTALTLGSDGFSFLDASTPALPSGGNAGEQTLTFSGTTPVVGQWYYLRDTKKKETHATNTPTETRQIGGELVQVKSVSGTSVTLRAPLTQNYPPADDDHDPRLSRLPSDSVVTQNLLVRGLRIRGRTESGYECWLRAGLCAGITLQQCHGVDSKITGFSVAYSRDVTIVGCSAKNLDVSSGGGSGLPPFGSPF